MNNASIAPSRPRGIRHSLFYFVLFALFVAGGSYLAASARDGGDSAEPLLEIGGACARVAGGAPKTAECAVAASPVPSAVPRLKVVSYNIRWRSGDDLHEIINRLKTDAEIGKAQLIGLQEVDRDRKRSANTNTARVMAEALGMNYVWAAPPLPEREKKKRAAKEAVEEETGVALLSPFPLSDVVRIILPHEGPGGRRRAAVGATVHMAGASVRFYSVHAETRVSVEERTEQLKAVLDDLARHPAQTPAVVLGDFNSWQPDSKRDLIQLFRNAGFHTPFPPGQPTFRHKLVKLRLDWIWLRGFSDVEAYGIARHIKVSDHYPLWLDAPLKQETRDENGAMK